MSYTLHIGDRSYSSWSMRAGLLVDRFAIPYRLKTVDFHAQDVAETMSVLPPARTVPVLETPEGAVVWDSLAIAEELAARHPDKGLWPTDPALRANARSLAAEMHCSYSALRNDCPMNLRTAYDGFPASEAVKTDVDRIDTVWQLALGRSGGPWLCGEYSIADAFFAPVAARIAGYGLQVGPDAQAYIARHLADPAFRRWRAMGLVKGADLPWYAKDCDTLPWPGPQPLPAVVHSGPSVNDACPYSGDPVTDYLELGGIVYGFCNPFCRDKTLADPEAWPAFVALRHRTA